MYEISQSISDAWKSIDEAELQNLAVDLINIPSATGQERRAAEHLVSFMKKADLQANLMQLTETRANAIGRVQGKGDGPSLMFNGHLDTSFTGLEQEDFPMTGPLGPAFKPKAYMKDGWIYGLGAINMKGAVAALTEAVCSLKRAGTELKGDVLAVGVAGEIEKAPVNGLFRSYTGDAYEGGGYGMEHLLKQGTWPDFSITCEPTGMAVTRAKCGYMLVKLTTEGDLTYRPYSDEDRVENAILSMAKVVEAIDRDFAPRYTDKHTYDLGEDDGVLKPRVNVGSIESGWPFKPGFVPAICNAYLDVRLVPSIAPIDAKSELGDFLSEFQNRTGVHVSIDVYAVKGPSLETPADSFLVKTCKKAFEFVSKTKHVPSSPGRQSFGDDTNITRKHGIPSVTWGPGGQLPEYAGAAAAAGGEGEFIKLGDLVTACKMYIACAIDICSKSKTELKKM